MDTFQAQTPWGAGLQSLSKAFFAGPSPLKRADMQSDIDLNTARMAEIRGKIQAQEREAKAGGIIADAITQLNGPAPEAARPVPSMIGPMPEMSPEDRVRAAMPAIATALGGTPQVGQIGAMLRTLMANQPGTSDSSVVRSMAGAGNALGVNESVSIPGQTAVRDANAGHEKDKELAKIAATPLTEAQARGKAFGLLAPALAKMSVGPTRDEAAGTILANNFENLPVMPPAQQHALGAQPTQQTPRSYITPSGLTGTSFDGLTDAVTGAKMPQGTTYHTTQLQPNTADGIRPTVRGDVQGKVIDLGVYNTFSESLLKSYDENPAAFGTRGNLARLSDGLLGQARDMLGPNSPLTAQLQDVTDTLAGKSTGTNGQPVNDDLQGPVALAKLMPFVAAAAIVGQSGKSLSNEDRAIVQEAVGDPTSWLSDRSKVTQRLKMLNGLVANLAGKYQGVLDTGKPGAAGASPEPATAPRRIKLVP